MNMRPEFHAAIGFVVLAVVCWIGELIHLQLILAFMSLVMAGVAVTVGLFTKPGALEAAAQKVRDKKKDDDDQDPPPLGVGA